jgi:hypothetical protein
MVKCREQLTGKPMEEVKRRLLKVWNVCYAWLESHWLGLTIGFVAGAVFL